MNSTPCTEAKVQVTPQYAFNLAPRCGAKTRTGTPCKSPAVRHRRRCRMHGGAKGSGAPKGNQNAFKDGHTSRISREHMREIRGFLKKCCSLLASTK